MIRAFLCVTEIVLFLIFTLPLLLVLWIWKQFAPEAAAELGQRCVGWILTVITGTAMGRERLTVLGLEEVPRGEGVLFVSNHRSFFDIITSYPVIPLQTGFVAKESLRRIPILRRWMQLLNCQFLKRDDIRQGMEVIKRAAKQVEEGGSVWICPEGTRNKSEDSTELLPFHEASFKVAVKSGCKIVPVAFYGTDRLWEAQFPRVKPYPVTILFGKPFTVGALNPDWKRKPGAYASAQILRMLQEEAARRGEGNRKEENQAWAD